MVRPSDKAAREVKLAEIKRQIAAGTYDSSERLEQALDKFLDQQARSTQRPGKPR
jgi:hypothetical protein